MRLLCIELEYGECDQPEGDREDDAYVPLERDGVVLEESDNVMVVTIVGVADTEVAPTGGSSSNTGVVHVASS